MTRSRDSPYPQDPSLQVFIGGMGYFEYICQLCGVSFAIGRIRRPDEPVSTASHSPNYPCELMWDSTLCA
jgi:hypothetical protein